MSTGFGSKAATSGIKKLYSGFGKMRVVGICPTNEQLAKIYNTEVDETKADKDYIRDQEVDVWEGGEKVKKDARVLDFTIFLQEETTKAIFSHRIPIWDVLYLGAPNPDDETQGNKMCFANSWGNVAYVQSESELKANFKRFNHSKDDEKSFDKVYRRMLKGESNLVDFLKTWLNFNVFEPDTNFINYSTKDLFKGNFKLFNDVIANPMYTKAVLGYGIVETVEDKDDRYQKVSGIYPLLDNVKVDGKYKDISNYKELEKKFKNGEFKTENLDAVLEDIQKVQEEQRMNNGRYLYTYERILLSLLDGNADYPVNGLYEIGPWKELDESNVYKPERATYQEEEAGDFSSGAGY